VPKSTVTPQARRPANAMRITRGAHCTKRRRVHALLGRTGLLWPTQVRRFRCAKQSGAFTRWDSPRARVKLALWPRSKPRTFEDHNLKRLFLLTRHKECADGI